MSTSWPAPDPRPSAAVAPTFASPPLELDQPAPPVARDLFAGALAAAVTVLVGAPVGLLWAALAPRVDVVLEGGQVQLVETASSGFIAGDGAFLLAVALAGALGGLATWWLGRAHGPAVVVGLALGGAAAAYVAMVVGLQVGLEEVQRAVDTGLQGAFALPPTKLRAREALVGWPVGSLLAYVGASLARGR